MKIFKLISATVTLALFLVGISAALPVQTRPQPSSASQPFDHSNCQYPDRWSNPPNGCDNSDPAVPECIKAFSTKAGEDVCIAAFVAEHEQPQPRPSETTTTPGIVKPNQCGGK